MAWIARKLGEQIRIPAYKLPTNEVQKARDQEVPIAKKCMPGGRSVRLVALRARATDLLDAYK